MARGFGANRYLTEEEKKNAPKVTPALLGRIFSYLLPYWPQLALTLSAILASSFLGLYPSMLTGRILDEGLIGRNFPVLARLVGLSFLVLVGSNLIGMLVSYLNVWIAQRITYDMRNQMYRHLQSMSSRFFTSSRQGDIITRMTSDISGVQGVISGTFASVLSNSATLAVALAAMFRRSPQLALLGLVIVPLFSLPARYAGKTRWKITLDAQKCNDEANQILNETLSVSGQLLVKLFTAEDREYQRYRRVNAEMVRNTIKESMAGRLMRAVLSTFTGMGPMLIYLAGGALLILRSDTGLSVGDITVMVALLDRMYRPVDQLMNLQVDITRSMALFTRIFQYFDLPAEIVSPETPRNRPDAPATVEFDHVKFAYDPQVPILRDIHFTVPQHRCVAIVGASGSGKSTLVNLIPRLYDTVEGAVRVGGTDVRQWDLAALRSRIGVVSQDTYLFNGTVRENLLYAKPDATQAQLEEACRKANIHDFIAAQPEGYDTLVGNRGLKLSGGEKQRIAIARVILKDPDILIFDEATSALDSISENAIQEAIEPLLHQRTGIVIAHRLSTVIAADEILVLQDGRIAERGTHAQLVEQGGVYTRLYETQFRRALEDYRRREQAGEP